VTYHAPQITNCRNIITASFADTAKERSSDMNFDRVIQGDSRRDDTVPTQGVKDECQKPGAS
jgi:hypothetical protein